jgi:fumarate reductase flavoprotein subunit
VNVKTEFDAIVVGGGGSGLAAAVSAAELGCSVLLLEKQSRLGGTTRIAVGSFTASGTALQRARGIADDAQQHAEDAGKFASSEIEARNNAALRRFFLSHAAATLDWLMAMGLSFFGPHPEPPNRVPRMHNVVPGAQAYIAALESRLVRLGGVIICNAGVTSIIQNDGRVTGVRASLDGQVMEFRASRGVVLAAGDYANSPEMIAEFKDPRFAHIEGINPNAAGDGHRLAQSVGARLVNMDVTYGPEIRFVAPENLGLWRMLPTRGPVARLLGWLTPWMPRFLMHAVIRRLLVTWQHPENALFDDDAILVNQRGERFCDERQYPDREIALAKQEGKVWYLLLDERLIERYSMWPHFISTAPRIAYAYVEDYLWLRPDVAVAGDSVAKVAELRGIPVAALEATVREFNRTADRPLAGKRWVLLGPAKAYFTTTEGGAAIDEQLRVLDASGRPIRGLYAVGQNGLGGQILWGHGLHIAWAITSGRLVGKVLGRRGRE